jgi:ribonuclease E
VQPYRDTTPIFVRSGIEAQLDRMLQPQVTLKSGGYLIINQTEALVAIDVNSGRSTKEDSIEETALHTNLEAAEEVARQLRLRDLAGLIVIDFIDMEENRNNRAVEKRLKDHLKNDRARIQVGRISHFGLMEMSRQRIRASVLESTMKPCPHCGGTGHVRSDSSVALAVVRAIEEFLLKDSKCHITVRTPVATALYVLNHKRGTLVELESRFGLTITIEADDTVGAQLYAIARGPVAEKPAGFVEARALPVYDEPEEPEIAEEEDEETSEAATEETPRQTQQHARPSEDGEGRDRKRRRRRRRRGGKDREHGDTEHGDNGHESVADDATSDSGEPVIAGTDGDGVVADVPDVSTNDATEASDDAQAKKRRRGKRGGKRNRPDEGEQIAEANAAGDAAPVAAEGDAISEAPVEATEEPVVAEAEVQPEEKPKKSRRVAKPKKAAAAEEVSEVVAEAPVEVPAEPVAEEATAAPAGKKPVKPRAPRRKPAAAAAEAVAEPGAAPVVSSTVADAPIAEPEVAKPAETKPVEAEGEAEEKPKRAGWWQRKGFF